MQLNHLIETKTDPHLSEKTRTQYDSAHTDDFTGKNISSTVIVKYLLKI